MRSPQPKPGAVQRVVLTGFMGSGKSTVGRLLAKRLGWAFADLDEAVEARLQLSVPEIFALRGEGAFREAEAHDLGLLLGCPGQVIALGGGAPATPAVQLLLRDAAQTLVIHLEAPFSTLFERCQRQALDPAATDRPLLGDAAAAARRFGERMEIYSRVAHQAVNASTPPEAVATAIQALLAGPKPVIP